MITFVVIHTVGIVILLAVHYFFGGNLGIMLAAYVGGVLLSVATRSR